MNPKAIIIGGAATVIILAGGVMIMSRAPQRASVERTAASRMVVDHDNFNWGQINYDGGLAKHTFPIENGGEGQMKLANVKTSCMCTVARIVTRAGTSPWFKMHQQSEWTGVLEPGEIAQLEIEFDPAFHGPGGAGPVERIISLETSDPNQPYVEFNLKGVVIKS